MLLLLLLLMAGVSYVLYIVCSHKIMEYYNNNINILFVFARLIRFDAARPSRSPKVVVDDVVTCEGRRLDLGLGLGNLGIPLVPVDFIITPLISHLSLTSCRSSCAYQERRIDVLLTQKVGGMANYHSFFTEIFYFEGRGYIQKIFDGPKCVKSASKVRDAFRKRQNSVENASAIRRIPPTKIKFILLFFYFFQVVS
jgi:hypothetical protein